MAFDGELPLPDLIIFADTQWEPKHVYEQLEWLKGRALAAGRDITVVSAGNIREDALRSRYGQRFASMPLFVENEEGKRGMLKRQCTSEYKIKPVHQAVRRHLGLKRRQRFPKDVRVRCWLGISFDEVQRMSPSRMTGTTNVYPLIEKHMYRSDCERWLLDHGYPVPKKSSCVGCPFHDDRHWRDMQLNDPETFADAVDFDALIRTDLKQVTQKAFLHGSLEPLGEVALRTEVERGQGTAFPHLIDDCSGMCGV